jgi:hypothetical protein
MFFLFLCFFSSSLTNMQPLQKIRRVLFVKFITFGSYFFNCIKFKLLFFQFDHLAFDFYIKICPFIL